MVIPGSRKYLKSCHYNSQNCLQFWGLETSPLFLRKTIEDSWVPGMWAVPEKNLNEDYQLELNNRSEGVTQPYSMGEAMQGPRAHPTPQQREKENCVTSSFVVCFLLSSSFTLLIVSPPFSSDLLLIPGTCCTVCRDNGVSRTTTAMYPTPPQLTQCISVMRTCSGPACYAH